MHYINFLVLVQFQQISSKVIYLSETTCSTCEHLSEPRIELILAFDLRIQLCLIGIFFLLSNAYGYFSITIFILKQ